MVLLSVEFHPGIAFGRMMAYDDLVPGAVALLASGIVQLLCGFLNPQTPAGVTMSRKNYCTMAIILLTIASLACVLGLQLPANTSEDHAPLEYNIPPVTYLDPATGKTSPFFPIGWYSFGPLSEDALQEVYDNGCNTALFAGLGLHGWQKADAQARLNQAQELGMKIIIGFNPSMVAAVEYGKPETYGSIPDYVASFKDHPALLGWQLGDEMGADQAPRISDAVRVIRDGGSQHQAWQVHSHIESNDSVRALMANTDVCTYDGYTYHPGSPVFADVCSTRILAWQQAKADLIQAEGWAGNVNVTQAVGCSAGSAHFRFPTYEEYRWNVFSAIASVGARGTLNWIYCYWQGFYPDAPQVFFDFRDQVVKPVNLEQQMITHAMETGYNVGQVRSNLDELTTAEIPPATGPHYEFNKVGHILLYDDQEHKYFLIVTNNETSPSTVLLQISDLPVPLASLTIREPHDNRELTLQNAGGGHYLLRDKLGNHDVAIYVLKAK